MNILVFCPAISFASGSGIRGRLLVDGLVRAGASVGVVLTAPPADWNSPAVRIYPGGEGVSWGDVLQGAVDHFCPDMIFGITEACADIVVGIAKKNGCVSALDLHGLGFVEVLELGSGYGARLPRIWRSLKWLRQMFAADVVTAANPELYRFLRKLSRRVHPLFGGTDVALFSPEGETRSLGVDRDAIQVLYAGNEHKWQGVELLIEAIAQLGEDADRFEFNFLGPFERLRKRCVERADLPVGRLHFIDPVDYSSVPSFYRAADVLVLPRPFMLSTYLALPQKMSDYLASGRTVLATDLAPHRWALGNPAAGILCVPSASGVAEGLRASRDMAVRSRLGRMARFRAEEMFSHESQGAQLVKLFEKVLGKEGGGHA